MAVNPLCAQIAKLGSSCEDVHDGSTSSHRKHEWDLLRYISWLHLKADEMATELERVAGNNAEEKSLEGLVRQYRRCKADIYD